MNRLISAVIVALLVACAGTYWWRNRRAKPETRLISLVALTREAVTFDPAMVAHVAGKVWQADLGNGASEGADGFVASTDIMTVVMVRGQMYMINSFPAPYVQEIEEVSAAIADLRIRGLFREHTAWYSIDAMGIDNSTPVEEVQEHYRRIARLFGELLDERCLLIFVPDEEMAYPINEDTERALRSRNPVQALGDTQTVPVVEVKDDDPLMLAAVARARAEWPRFTAAFDSQAGMNFSVKAPVTSGGNTEFIWIEVTSIEGERVYGTLGNDPGNLGVLKHGSKVSVKIADPNDWCFIDDADNMQGGFTVEVVRNAARGGG